MTEHNDIPYYHSRVQENQLRFQVAMLTLLEEFGTYHEGDDELIISAIWDQADLGFKYEAIRRAEPFDERFSKAVQLNITTEYPDGQVSVKAHSLTDVGMFMTSNLVMTKEEIAEHDELFRDVPPAPPGQLRAVINRRATMTIEEHHEYLADVAEEGLRLLRSGRTFTA